jgi:hypothetical protein
MKRSTRPTQESIDDQIIENLCQLQSISLGKSTVVCQAGGETLRDGEDVKVYAVRPGHKTAWRIGQTRCTDPTHTRTLSLETQGTLGARELIVTGRIGRCVDQAFQTDWPVLLNPEIQAVSPCQTRSTVRVPAGKLTSPTDSDGANTRQPPKRPQRDDGQEA